MNGYSETDVREILTSLGVESKQETARITCCLLGHSRVQKYCSGIYYCARCGAAVEDSINIIFPGRPRFILGFNVSREAYQALSWQDKLFTETAQGD